MLTKRADHDETRTRNLLIRSQTPYPLGHAVIEETKWVRSMWTSLRDIDIEIAAMYWSKCKHSIATDGSVV